MKSVSYAKNIPSMRGKKTLVFMAGKHIEDVFQNFKEKEYIKELEKEMRL